MRVHLGSHLLLWLLAVTILHAQRPVAAEAKTEEPAWFAEAKYGVMFHYLVDSRVSSEEWSKQVDAFDVAAFAETIAGTGVNYVMFTIGQNSGHYCAPNATYDKLVGIVPSKCSRRDLIADLAKVLKERDIRLMVYLPSGAPAADHEARRKLKWLWGAEGGWQLPGEPVGGRLEDFQRHWEAVISEWSKRWGTDVSGWWIDGCYFADKMYLSEMAPNFTSFAAALKSGNPDSVVAFNPGVGASVRPNTKHDDYSAGEVNLPQLPVAAANCHGRWIECDGKKVRFHILTYLGTTWGAGDEPQMPDAEVARLAEAVTAKGGVVTFDVPVRKDGSISKPFLKQLKAIITK